MRFTPCEICTSPILYIHQHNVDVNMNTDLFPKTKVTGIAFCNREKEREKLANYIDIGRHAWIQEYRRHGKSSLVEQTIMDMLQTPNRKLVYGRAHLRFTSDISTIIKKLIATIDTIARTILTNNLDDNDMSNLLKKGAEILTTTFHKLTPTVSLSGTKINVSTTQIYDLDTLEASLRGLDRLADKFDFRAVVFIDEFQEIGKLPDHMQIESTLRECLEDAKSTTYIVAGSERTLMTQALSDKKRPLYNHMQIIALSRISEDKYEAHLSALATKRWGGPINHDAFLDIMFYTQRHPYYVNCLCDELWQLKDTPVKDDVSQAWNEIVQIAARENAYEIANYSTNERRIIIAISKGLDSKMVSAKALSIIKLAPSSIKRSLDALIARDVIAKDLVSSRYFIIDPAIATLAFLES